MNGLEDPRNDFRFLNREGRWLDFTWEGLELRADGALQLLSLPSFANALPAHTEGPEGPAGIAIDIDGVVFFSDPAAGRVWRSGGCFTGAEVVPCLGKLDKPRGLLIPPHRRALFIADSGAGRVSLFDPESFELLDAWDGFGEPWSLATDPDGNVYVVEHGARRIRKFGYTGDPVPGFWDNVQASGTISEPAEVAFAGGVLFVLDLASGSVWLFQPDGNAVLDSDGYPVAVRSELIQQPVGLAASESAVYVGDNRRGAILVFRKKSGRYVLAGEARGYRGAIAALALDGKGGLLAGTAGGAEPLALSVFGGFAGRGAMLSRALSIPNRTPQWTRLQARFAEHLPVGAHVQLYTRTSDSSLDPVVDLSAADPFSGPEWLAFDLDLTDLYIGGEPRKHLWIGARFMGDGASSPELSQMRIEFDHAGYERQLPEIYRENGPSKDFFVRFLALFESFFAEVEQNIGELPALFDPMAIGKESLPWLAGFLALDLSEDMPEQAQREAVAAAFARYARRGTADGLREALAAAAVNAIVEEPAVRTNWWLLPHPSRACTDKGWEDGASSILGFTTVLAAAEPQGAVVGTTATLDRSHLIGEDEFGTPLFDDVAHQFSVLVYRGEVDTPRKMAEVKAILERERPAHTAYHLCVIEPAMRVGFQSRLGIDTVVAGDLQPSRLGEGRELVLAGQPAGRLGSATVGGTARL